VGELVRQLKKPVRAANDADVQGFGAIKGKGVELVITLGTGFGTALFINGTLVPNLEIAHHPFRKGQTYEGQLGANALMNTVGKKRWNQRLAKAIAILDRVINFDHLYIGGGNGKKVTIPLPPHVTIVSNAAGLLGGIALWADPNLSLSPSTKDPGNGTARKRAPRKKPSKTLKKIES
jgi:polyphosphate glucokinase